MSTPTQEQAFYDAVVAAEMARQGAKSLAQSNYGFVKANYAAYVTALVAADAYVTAITTAATANGVDANLGTAGPLCAKWCKIGGN
jgi:hypothetical protein